jgi:hypothetical protein
MTRRNRYFTPAQRAALILLGGGALGSLVVLGLLAGADWLAPQPPAPVVVAARVTLSPRPPTATQLPTATPPPSATATASNSPSPTNSPTITLTPTATESPTPTPTRTHTPTPSSTPLWPTAVPATWAAATPKGRLPPTLADFWAGRASWQLDVPDAGLPVGESDTLIGPDGQLWSYLHASTDTLGIHDQWGAYVPFPGCVTLWQSGNKGKSFHLFDPHCLIACLDKPCDDGPDDIDVQQYPRVARSEAGTWVMVYEWRGQVYLRTSADGLNWARSRHVPGTGLWPASVRSCPAYQNIGQHPNVLPGAETYNCLSGGPPGLFVQGRQMWVFVGLGQNPGHMGCYTGLIDDGAAGLKPCSANPLFAGASSYGPLDAAGPAANPYFDFSIVSAADILRVGDRYYMTYEGARGPAPGDAGDTQFNLGFARSATDQIDGPWEKYLGNPVLGDVPGNVGLGHADLIVLDGVTYLYTATSGSTRGRYALLWKSK